MKQKEASSDSEVADVKSVYYSHAKIIKNSKQEKEDIALLESFGFEVDNPHHPRYDEFWETEGMEFSKTLIEANEFFVFRCLPTGKISIGVAKEIKIAQSLGKPILELPYTLSERMLTLEETLEFAKEIGR